MRTFRWIFLILFFASVLAAAVLAAIEAPELKRLVSERRDKEARFENNLTKLKALNTKFRGFLESSSAIPDSLRKQETGSIMKKQEEYRKGIFNLELRDRNLKRAIKKDTHDIGIIYDRVKARLFILGAAAVVFLVLAIFTGRAAIRS